jgi:hypothetical protein
VRQNIKQAAEVIRKKATINRAIRGDGRDTEDKYEVYFKAELFKKIRVDTALGEAKGMVERFFFNSDSVRCTALPSSNIGNSFGCIPLGQRQSNWNML